MKIWLVLLFYDYTKGFFLRSLEIYIELIDIAKLKIKIGNLFLCNCR